MVNDRVDSESGSAFARMAMSILLHFHYRWIRALGCRQTPLVGVHEQHNTLRICATAHCGLWNNPIRLVEDVGTRDGNICQTQQQRENTGLFNTNTNSDTGTYVFQLHRKHRPEPRFHTSA